MRNRLRLMDPDLRRRVLWRCLWLLQQRIGLEQRVRYNLMSTADQLEGALMRRLREEGVAGDGRGQTVCKVLRLCDDRVRARRRARARVGAGRPAHRVRDHPAIVDRRGGRCGTVRSDRGCQKGAELIFGRDLRTCSAVVVLLKPPLNFPDKCIPRRLWSTSASGAEAYLCQGRGEQRRRGGRELGRRGEAVRGSRGGKVGAARLELASGGGTRR